MLVFRRNAGESFLVGDNVEVRILEIGRNQVKIGVVAPREIGIYRSEISRLNRKAAVDSLQSVDLKNAVLALQRALQKREKDQPVKST